MLSTLSRKMLMCLTGLFLGFFLLIHFLGNLQLFLPQEQAHLQFNAYSHFLSGNIIIKIVSYVLYASIILHAVDGLIITLKNKKSGGGYQSDRRGRASKWASRNMGILGTLILIFLVIHFQNFWYIYKFGNPPLDENGNKDLYILVVNVFKEWWYVIIYVLSMIALCYHLIHGIHSAVRTLGLYHPKFVQWFKTIGIAYSIIICVGFALMPGVCILYLSLNRTVMILDSKIPQGPLEHKWDNYKKKAKLVNPANRKKLDVIVVGTGLAGSSIAASLGEMGYNVKSFCFQDSPRRAHSVAAQGGVNAAKNYKNDGDSVYRMFVDTLKGGDFRAREANVYRMAECSLNLIDQAVAQGVPFGREYGGYLNNRSFGGVQVSRTFYARGQTGQQLLLGAYQALMRQVGKGSVQLFSRHEMLDLVTVDGKARGIIVRNLDTGDIERHAAHAVVLATGGYGKIYYLSTLAMGCNGSAIWRAHKKGALMASPSWIQVHPTSLPQSGDYQSKLTLMSESLRNDGRIWVPLKEGENRPPNNIPENERDYYLERRYPAFGNLAPRDISSRAAKERIDAGFGIGPLKNAVYLDFSKAIQEQGKDKISEKYGNLFDMYLKITGYDAYKEPMMISPSAHFSMGGLWIDYELMTTIPGLFALGEANFADHGANRLGANSLLQASVDGYFIAPYTIANYLADEIHTGKISPNTPEFEQAENAVKEQIRDFISIKGTKTVDYFHKTLGKLLYDYCGLARNEEGLKYAIQEIRKLKEEFYKDVRVSGQGDKMNTELEKAGRVADYFEIGELMCYDALTRNESCGAHFREEFQTPDGEAMRNDAEYQFISAWAWTGENGEPELIKEPLTFEEIQPTVRSYK